MEEEYEYLYKIVIVGNSMVGKTKLLLRFVNDSFVQESKPTIGVEYFSKIMQAGGTTIKAQLWDTTGQEKYRAISQVYYRNAVGALLVYDVTDMSSFEAMPQWLKELRNNTDQSLRIFLVGNKCDMEESRRVTSEEGEEFAKKEQIGYVETSALTGRNVEESFRSLVRQIYKQCEDGDMKTNYSMKGKRGLLNVDLGSPARGRSNRIRKCC